ncbi:MAG: DNA helicase-4 [Paraglaciecola sp.]
MRLNPPPTISENKPKNTSVNSAKNAITHSWFGRWFEDLQADVLLSAQGFTLPPGYTFADLPDGQALLWQHLDSPPEFEWHWLGSLMHFTINGKAYRLSYLSYFAALNFRQSLQCLWAEQNQQALTQLIQKVEHAVQRQYLCQSRLVAIQGRVAREFKRWFPWCETVALHPEVQAALVKLHSMHHWHATDVARMRESYVQGQLSTYGHFFDQVETHPLTDKQRRACVIDDDNNLILAGAGTGKTSVMVGRAGYLVASGQAQPEDILLLAYGKKAADEMNERIKHKLGTLDIKASTFHSLGLKIIAQVEGEKPCLSPWVNDEKAKDQWVQETLETLIEEPAYRAQLFEYFSHYYYVQKSPFDFTSEGEYFAYLTDNDIRSLKAERVKSFGELYIANWLFEHGIEYCYEARYEHDVVSVDFRPYQPDFYLWEYGVYIEYYGIDEGGNTAPYIDNQAYQATMKWTRQLHHQRGTSCIELFYFQHKSGVLLPELERLLQNFAVVYSPLPDEAILATLQELNRVTELATLFSQLISLYKAACLDKQGLEQMFDDAADSQQARMAFTLLSPVYAKYEQHLAGRREIDFEDMITRALAYVQQGQFVAPWRYIMVDEFQDISEPRARLVRALGDNTSQGASNPASIFCVGDDWQAIYRFSGADVSLTTDFAAYFGATTTNFLDLTFRFNNRIGEVATAFVRQNPRQLAKDIHSMVQVETPAISILRRAEHQGATAQEPSVDALNQALAAIAQRGKGKVNAGGSNNLGQTITETSAGPVSVFMLARFGFTLPNSARLRALNAHYINLHIEAMTFHGAKGKEADYVVIMGMTGGKHGFPSSKITPPLLDGLLPKAEAFPFGEERRLFYVALTRARHRVYVLADMTNVSPFVVELIEQPFGVELDEFATSLVQRVFADIHCAVCKTGTLKAKHGKFGVFYACSHFPLCDNSEKGCQRCHNPTTGDRIVGFKVCLDEACGHIAPVCSQCGGDMALRQGARGSFWGCLNYRGKEKPSCKHTVEESALHLPR